MHKIKKVQKASFFSLPRAQCLSTSFSFPLLSTSRMDTRLEKSDTCLRCSCGQPAKIECLLCVKARAYPAPCFCSKSCFEAHWKLHKQLQQGYSHTFILNPHSLFRNFELIRPFAAPYHFPVECHSFDPAAPPLPRNTFQSNGAVPYMWNPSHYLMTAPTHPTHRRE